MSFTGNPGTGKTTVALRMAEILHRLGYVRQGHLVAVTRDDLVGQYIGHTAPKTKEVLKRAMGGVLFIDEAYYLYRPENERDYGQEAIEILLQVMENQRDDLVVIFAGYEDRMDTFFGRTRAAVAHRASHRLSRLRANDELLAIAELMLGRLQYRLQRRRARTPSREYIALRRAQPQFANARSIRNALDRARLRQANRLFAARAQRARPRMLDDDRGGGHPREPRLRRGGQAEGASSEARGREDRTAKRRSPSSSSRSSAARRRRPATSLAAQRRVARMQADLLPVRRGSLGGILGETDTVNVQGEAQKTLDVVANEIFLRTSEWGGQLAGMVSEEMEEPHAIPPDIRAASTCWCSIRSTARATSTSTCRSAASSRCCARRTEAATPVAADFLQPGTHSVARGMPSTAPRRCWC